MKFQFETLVDFFTMAGHGGYVWACYAITLIALISLAVLPRQKKHELVTQIQRQQRIQSNSSEYSISKQVNSEQSS